MFLNFLHPFLDAQETLLLGNVVDDQCTQTLAVMTIYKDKYDEICKKSVCLADWDKSQLDFNKLSSINSSNYVLTH